MLKKIIILTIASYSLSCAALCNRETLVEVKGSGFIPTSNLYKHIYHSSGMIGGEITMNIHEHFYGWAAIDWTRKTGRSLIGLSRTKVSYLPISFGLKYFIPNCHHDWYVGIGALAARIHTHDFSPNVAPFYTKWGWGAVAKLGVIVDVSPCLFFDFFVNGSWVQASSHNTNGGTVVPHRVKIHAAIVGMGLGYRF